MRILVLAVLAVLATPPAIAQDEKPSAGKTTLESIEKDIEIATQRKTLYEEIIALRAKELEALNAQLASVKKSVEIEEAKAQGRKTNKVIGDIRATVSAADLAMSQGGSDIRQCDASHYVSFHCAQKKMCSFKISKGACILPVSGTQTMFVQVVYGCSGEPREVQQQVRFANAPDPETETEVNLHCSARN